MSTYEDIDKLIDLYLQGYLSEAQNEDFRLRLEHDPALTEKVEQMRLINEVVLGAELDYLREKIAHDLHKTQAKRKFKQQLTYGGVFTAIIAGLFFIYFTNDKTQNENIPVSNTTTPTPIIEKTVEEVQSPKPQIVDTTKNIITNATPKKNHSVATTKEEKVTHKKDTFNSASVNKSTELTTKTKNEKQTTIPEASTIDTASTNGENKKTILNTATVDPCEKVSIKLFPKTEASCSEKPTGSIVLRTEDIIGGEAPYLIYLNNTKINYEVTEELAPGAYMLTLIDNNHCMTEKTIIIASKVCKRVQSFSFNPDYGELWEVPIKKENAQLYIYNRAGVIVFQTTINNTGFEWDGKDKNGTSLTEGLYIYILEYSSGEKENGQITIVR